MEMLGLQILKTVRKNKMKNENKKAQMKISFQLIFAIILIVIFIVFGIFAIKKFAITQENIGAADFIFDIEEEISLTLRQQSMAKGKVLSVPRGVEEVCFEQQPSNSGNPNMYSVPEGIIEGWIEGINWVETNPSGEKLCIEANELKKIFVSFNINYEDDSVTIIDGKDFVLKELEFREGEFIRPDLGTGPQNQGDNYANLQGKSCGDFTIYWSNDFEQRPLGRYEHFNDFQREWNSGGVDRWEFTKVVSGIGDNPTQSFEVPFPHYDVTDFKWACWCDSRCQGERGTRKLFDNNPGFGCNYKVWGVGPGSGGVSARTNLPRKNVYYLSYKVRFGEGFNPVGGGKLPGLCGGTCVGGGGSTDKNGDGTSDGFSARLMFGSPRRGEEGVGGMFYVYHPDRDSAEEGGYGSGQHFNKDFQDGEWHTIIQRVQMNTLNQENGRLTAWMDGELITDQGGYAFRQGASEEFAIEKIMFVTFFGGGGDRYCNDDYMDYMCNLNKIEDWMQKKYDLCAVNPNDPCSELLTYSDGSPILFYTPRKDEVIHFDDIVVYTYSGSYSDGDAWPPDLNTC
jgi:polysaccharide lyase-like protein